MAKEELSKKIELDLKELSRIAGGNDELNEEELNNLIKTWKANGISANDVLFSIGKTFDAEVFGYLEKNWDKITVD